MSHPEPWKPEAPSSIWRRRLIKTAVAVGLTLGAVLGYDAYDSWRYSHLIETAKSAAALGDWRQSSFALRRAVQIRPGTIEPLILLAETAEKLNPSEAISLRLAVATADRGSVKHRFDLVRTALRIGDKSSAAQSLATIDVTARTTPMYLSLKSQVALATGDPVSAEAAALEALRLEPANPTYKFHLASIQVGSTNEATRASARNVLEQSTGIPELKHDALRMLSVEALNRRDAPVARRWVEEIFRTGKTDFGDEIQQLELLRVENSPALTTRLESLQRRATSNPQSTLSLATWMMMRTGNGGGAHAWLASLGTNITAQPAIQNARIQSHLLSNDVNGCIRWLEGDFWGENDHSRLLWLARLHRTQSQEASAKTAWNKAWELGGKNPQSRRQIWQMAVEMGWKEESMQVLQAASAAPSDSRWAQMVLFDIHYRLKQTPQMLEISERLLRASPEDWFAKNNVAAFSLLLNTNIAMAAKLASEAITTRPNDPLVTSTHAFALQRNGKIPEALLVFGRIPDAVRSKPGVAVYYASALVEAGRIKEARRYLTLADDASLLPEERALLNASLLKASQAPSL